MTTSRFLVVVAMVLAGCPASTPPTVVPPPAAVVKAFAATPAQLARPGDMVTLTWDTQDAQSVSLEHVGKGPLAIDGSKPQGTFSLAITSPSIFVLTARGMGGTDSAVQSVSVQGASAGFLFDAAPRSIAAGESTTLVWNVPGATTVSIKPAGGTATDFMASGSFRVSPSADTRYELTAGTLQAAVDVKVTPRIVSFGAPSPAPGQPVQLSWAVVGGGSKLSLEREGVAAPLREVSAAAEIASGQFSDTVPALPVDGVLRYHLKLEYGGKTQVADLEVRVGGSLKVVNFNVPAYVRAGFAYAVNWRTTGGSALEVSVDDVPAYVAGSQGAVDQGSTTLPAFASGTRRVKLKVQNNRGSELTSTKTVTPVGMPTFVSFTSDKASVAQGGEPVVLSWSVTNAREVTITQEGVGVVHTVSGLVDTGQVTVLPNRPSNRYTLLASNGAGDSVAPASVTVTVGTPARLQFLGPAAVGGMGTVSGHSVPAGGAVHGLPVVAKNVAQAAFVDISGSTEVASLGPDFIGSLHPLGETFSTVLFGRRVAFQGVMVSPNGWCRLGDGFFDGPNTNQPIGTSLLSLSLAPYFRDLRLVSGLASSRVWVRLDNVGAERRLIVQWSDVEDKAFAGSRLQFQVQVLSGGTVVFAYDKFQGVSAVDGDLGIVNGSNTRVLQPNPLRPAAGDTFTFFGPATTPFSMPIEDAVYVAKVAVGSGFVEVEGDPRHQLQITEANVRPLASVTDGEWVEIQNTSASPLDLNGYTLSFGATSNHLINSSVVVPANSRVVLGQASNLGDSTAAVTAAYVYPNTFAMPDTAGSVSLVLDGGTYSRLDWTTALVATAGTSVQADTQSAQGIYATPVSSVVCAAPDSGTYGLQVGTPGAPNQPRCFPYSFSRAAGAFESIADGGTLISGSTNDSVFTVATPVRYYGATVPTLFVSSNGWISTVTTSASAPTARALPSATAPVGTIAPWWMDHEVVTGAGNGLFRTVRDPDATPNSGDEYTVISWENFRFSGFSTHRLNFQVKFFANGNIEYHYGPLSTPGRDFSRGSFGTAWLEDRTGRAALEGSVFSTVPGLSEGTAFRFTYTP